jgi:hypothetical protein
VRRPCDACGEAFEPRTSRSRYCDRVPCRRKRARVAKREQRRQRVRRANVATLRRAPPGEAVAEAVRQELEAAGKLSTSIGQAALVLARRLDDPQDDTGSSSAALSKQLRTLMAEALEDMKIPNDPLDELRARRERRHRESGVTGRP